ncbi:MAG: hypothetical protein LBB83_02405 [Treponema sp.]|jgi:hypothetical protein|nr:hypothetical protein [Treponema sp.]
MDSFVKRPWNPAPRIKFPPAGGNDGYASTYFLFMLVLLSSLVLGMGLYLHSGFQAVLYFKHDNSISVELNRITAEVIDAIRNDPSPGIQCFADPVWAWHEKTQGDYTVNINPVSDRINLNFTRKNIFDKTALSLLFMPGKTSADLQQHREDYGLFLSPSAYEEFFIPANLDRYFSCYGWANINLLDEFAARGFARSLTGSDEAAERLRNTIETLLLDRRIASPGDLRMLFGINYRELFPFVNAEPLININHIDPDLLRELLAYPDYGVDSPEGRFSDILARREGEGIARAGIPRILGVAPENLLLHYLGSVTWFWEITVAGKSKTLRTVLCGFPPELDSGFSETDSRALPLAGDAEIEYQIIEQRYL